MPQATCWLVPTSHFFTWIYAIGISFPRVLCYLHGRALTVMEVQFMWISGNYPGIITVKGGWEGGYSFGSLTCLTYHVTNDPSHFPQRPRLLRTVVWGFDNST